MVGMMIISQSSFCPPRNGSPGARYAPAVRGMKRKRETAMRICVCFVSMKWKVLLSVNYSRFLVMRPYMSNVLFSAIIRGNL